MSLPLETEAEHDRVLERFDAAWRREGTAAIEKYLAGSGNVRRVLLEALIKVDLEYRWRCRAPAVRWRLEDYAARYPDLGPFDRLSLDLIGAEYWVRQHLGDRPPLTEYLKRFPGHEQAALRARLAAIDRELIMEFKDSGKPGRNPKASALPRVAAAAQVVAALRQSGFPDVQTLAEAEALARQVDQAQPLVKELIRRGRLTPYQGKLLLQARGSELVVGPYLVLERLGEGGAGQVFQARHLKLNRLVALKLIRRELVADPEILGRFQREIATISQLRHPNIVHAFDAGLVDDKHFLAMEFIEGTDLFQLVARHGPLPAATVIDLVRQAALGLQHIHEIGLVHRDIKPSNLLLQPDRRGSSSSGTVKILDLGLARFLSPSEEEQDREGKSPPLTKLGSVMMGTPDYLAPEQAVDFHSADIRADIYSLGCTLFYLLTGKPPFADVPMVVKLMKHQQVEPPLLEDLVSDVPAKLSAIARRMLAKQPEDRFQTPGELAKALADVAGSTPDLVEARSVPQPTIAPFRGRRLVWYGPLALFLLSGAGLFTVMVTGNREAADPTSAPNVKLSTSVPRILGEYKAPVYAVAFGHGGSVIVTGKDDGGVRLYDAATGRERAPLSGDIVQTRALQPLANGRLLVQGGRCDGPNGPHQAVMWDLEGGQATIVVNQEQLTTHAVNCWAVSPDGQALAIGTKLGTKPGGVRFGQFKFGVNSSFRETTFSMGRTEHADRVAALVFDRGGKVLASGSDDQSVRLWNAKGKEKDILHILNGHTGRVTCLACSPVSDSLVSGSEDQSLRTWDITTGQPRAVWPIGTTVHAVAFSPDGRTVAVGTGRGIALWDVASGRQPEFLPGHGGAVLSVAFSPNGNAILAGGEDCMLRLWQLPE